ncbi:MAG: (Fe-S)-binding protein [Gammaproteobacteria bacterium]
MKVRPQRVGLLVTCLIDLFRPNAGFAAVRLLEQAGCEVVVPGAQTCCGQPAYNSGDARAAQAIARQIITAFETFDYIVIPSGSCAGMVKIHYPQLFAQEAQWQQRALALAERTHELTSFLTDVLGINDVGATYRRTVTYHDSCSGLRELGIRAQPRRLLASVRELYLKELRDWESCCGFGGAFCVKYPEISVRMVSDKVASIHNTGADTVLGGDLGCLLNIAGCLKRQGSDIKVYHVAEILAGMSSGVPPIGEGTNRR